MPTGKKWDKLARKWVDTDKTREINYSDDDMYDAESWSLLISFIRAYPDWLLDLLESENARYNLELIQRVTIRANCSYEEVFVTGSRGTTKTFCVDTSSLVYGIVYPGTIRRYYAPTQKQGAEIASATFKELQQQYPALCAHWHVVSDAQERFEIQTDLGSEFSITVMRGDNAHSVVAEECAMEDAGVAFDHEKFRSSILPAIRLSRMVDKRVDNNCPQFQKLYITSAGRQQNPSFEYRKTIMNNMRNGQSAFCIDYPAEISVLSGIRTYSWYADMKTKLTPEEWLREMASIWTGASENPIIRDSTLTESKTVMVMENRHCGDKTAMYVIGYDVSYSDGATNAKCATCVIKCEEPHDNSDKYKKQLVNVFDNPPPRDLRKQALQLKDMWYRFCIEDGKPTYIAIDSIQYGRGVLEALHQDLGDGLPPLCCIDHDLRELELDGALPVIYPIRATGGVVGNHDADSEMIKYAEIQWENRNISILTTNVYEGVKAYKTTHRIKTDESDPAISIPYIKTKELCGQISNLKKDVAGAAIKEKRISKAIQRDMWSCVKYALRLIQILEYRNLSKQKRESSWAKAFNGDGTQMPQIRMPKIAPRILGRIGGNIR
jgi:hypothetical protein